MGEAAWEDPPVLTAATAPTDHIYDQIVPENEKLFHNHIFYKVQIILDLVHFSTIALSSHLQVVKMLLFEFLFVKTESCQNCYLKQKLFIKFES